MSRPVKIIVAIAAIAALAIVAFFVGKSAGSKSAEKEGGETAQPPAPTGHEGHLMQAKSLREVMLSKEAIARAMVEVEQVERKSVSVDIPMVGKVAVDERRVGSITARFSGRVDRLYVDFTGVRVEKDSPMVDMYSPELLVAQEELIQAKRGDAAILEATREKLRLWGLTKDQILEIEARRTPSDHITIYAPLSGIVIRKNAVEGTYVDTGTEIYAIADLSQVWVMLDAYEADLAWVRDGQDVELKVQAYPGETFAGRISFISPTLDEMTRTVKVRVDVPNPAGKLRPEMFAHATVRAAVASENEQMPLVIPATAPLVTGKRAVVYIPEFDEKKQFTGRFTGREILLGARAGEDYIVRNGLAEGEYVVTKGNFQIDSAVQIEAKPSMMSPEGGAGGGMAGMHHGGGETPKAAEGGAVMEMAPHEFMVMLDPVYAAYFKVHAALFADNLAEARAGYKELAEAITKVNAGILSGNNLLQWNELKQRLSNSSVEGSSDETLRDARQTFKYFSDEIILLEKWFSHAGEKIHFVMYSGDAFGGSGASWLQDFETVQNPYLSGDRKNSGDITARMAPMHAAPESGAPKEEMPGMDIEKPAGQPAPAIPREGHRHGE